MNLRNQGRQEESDAVWAQGLQIDPLHPSLAGNYANDRANHGDYDGAMRILQRFTHLPQMGGAVIFGLGTVNRDYGRYAKSIAGYPTHWDALSYAALGFHDEADRLTEDIGNLYILALGKRAVLHTRGEHAEAWAFVSAYLSSNGYEFKTLDPSDQAWILETQVLGGDYGGAIQRFESLGDGAPSAWIEDVDGTLVARLLNAIGFAYLQSGDTDAAMSVLSIEPMRLAHYKPWSSPLFLAPMALNAALQGDDELAYERLSQAVDKGWADYYRAINDPRWGDTLQQPRFVKLLERVQADLAEQRAEVEALLADAD